MLKGNRSNIAGEPRSDHKKGDCIAGKVESYDEDDFESDEDTVLPQESCSNRFSVESNAVEAEAAAIAVGENSGPEIDLDDSYPSDYSDAVAFATAATATTVDIGDSTSQRLSENGSSSFHKISNQESASVIRDSDITASPGSNRDYCDDSDDFEDFDPRTESSTGEEPTATHTTATTTTTAAATEANATDANHTVSTTAFVAVAAGDDYDAMKSCDSLVSPFQKQLIEQFAMSADEYESSKTPAVARYTQQPTPSQHADKDTATAATTAAAVDQRKLTRLKSSISSKAKYRRGQSDSSKCSDDSFKENLTASSSGSKKLPVPTTTNAAVVVTVAATGATTPGSIGGSSPLHKRGTQSATDKTSTSVTVKQQQQQHKPTFREPHPPKPAATEAAAVSAAAAAAPKNKLRSSTTYVSKARHIKQPAAKVISTTAATSTTTSEAKSVAIAIAIQAATTSPISTTSTTATAATTATTALRTVSLSASVLPKTKEDESLQRSVVADDSGDCTTPHPPLSPPNHQQQQQRQRQQPEQHQQSQAQYPQTSSANSSSPVDIASAAPPTNGTQAGCDHKQRRHHQQQQQHLPALRSHGSKASRSNGSNGRRWFDDPSHCYDEDAGLFSTFETQVSRELRKEESQAAEQRRVKLRLQHINEGSSGSGGGVNRRVVPSTAAVATAASAAAYSDRVETHRAQHRLQAERVEAEREELRLRMQHISALTKQSKRGFIKNAGNLFGPPPPAAIARRQKQQQPQQQKQPLKKKKAPFISDSTRQIRNLKSKDDLSILSESPSTAAVGVGVTASDSGQQPAVALTAAAFPRRGRSYRTAEPVAVDSNSNSRRKMKGATPRQEKQRRQPRFDCFGDEIAEIDDDCSSKSSNNSNNCNHLQQRTQPPKSKAREGNKHNSSKTDNLLKQSLAPAKFSPSSHSSSSRHVDDVIQIRDFYAETPSDKAAASARFDFTQQQQQCGNEQQQQPLLTLDDAFRLQEATAAASSASAEMLPLLMLPNAATVVTDDAEADANAATSGSAATDAASATGSCFSDAYNYYDANASVSNDSADGLPTIRFHSADTERNSIKSAAAVASADAYEDDFERDDCDDEEGSGQDVLFIDSGATQLQQQQQVRLPIDCDCDADSSSLMAHSLAYSTPTELSFDGSALLLRRGFATDAASAAAAADDFVSTAGSSVRFGFDDSAASSSLLYPHLQSTAGSWSQSQSQSQDAGDNV